MLLSLFEIKTPSSRVLCDSRNFPFEKAYCQYRLNQPKEALDTIKAAGSLDQKLKELKAQVLYRLEEYDHDRTATLLFY